MPPSRVMMVNFSVGEVLQSYKLLIISFCSLAVSNIERMEKSHWATTLFNKNAQNMGYTEKISVATLTILYTYSIAIYINHWKFNESQR